MHVKDDEAERLGFLGRLVRRIVGSEKHGFMERRGSRPRKSRRRGRSSRRAPTGNKDGRRRFPLRQKLRRSGNY